MLTIHVLTHSTLNIATGETRETERVTYGVYRPLIFAGQDIGEKVAEFDTREEAEKYVAEVR
jgi:hypothetical protein